MLNITSVLDIHVFTYLSPLDTTQAFKLFSKTSYSFGRLFNTLIINSMALIFPTILISSFFSLKTSRLMNQISGSLSDESNVLFAILERMKQYCTQTFDSSSPVQACSFLQESLQSNT